MEDSMKSQEIKTIVFILLFLSTHLAFSQTKTYDVLDFGNKKSEASHGLNSYLSETASNELKDKGKRMLPPESKDFRGGRLSFTMKVDPEDQNYFTARCWGSEKDQTTVMLFINGLQVGYRHLGDIDLFHRGNGAPPAYGKYYYITVPLPLQHTQGKEKVRLELRSYGPTWDYGETFERYQKDMSTATRVFYKAYTHTDPYFEENGKGTATIPVKDLPLRKEPGPQVLDALKKRVNASLELILRKTEAISQMEAWFLSDAYDVEWTVAYQNSAVPDKVAASIDQFYRDLKADPDLIFTDKSIYNPDWLNAGPYGSCVRLLWDELKGSLPETIPAGDSSVTRKRAWSYIFQKHLAYSTTHRRQYTNQSMIIDMFMHESNQALMLIDPPKALPGYQTLRYLYESVGLAPWLGAETESGPEKPLGDDYWQLTDKGLTKELGFVGYYGEVLDWVVHLYEGTGATGFPQSGDAKIREQLLKIMKARSYFRYPDADEEGFKAMRAEAVIGWRDGNHYPGNVLYGDRGIAWDATPLMSAAATLDEYAVGVAQQMIEDNQLFKMLADKMKLGGIRVTKSFLHVPDEYELIKAQAPSPYRLPMSAGMPDFVFSDEEDGVVAIKNGEEILYASLYWRARNAVNNLAKVHYITPEKQQVANIYIESEFEPSGMFFTRPGWVNLAFADWREFYPKDIKSAHTGEKLPIAKIPEGVPFEPGDENVYAGRANLYKMVYGNYFVAMNTTEDKVFTVEVPKDFRKGRELVTGKFLSEPDQQLAPRSTIVVYRSGK